jgi:hypothetical protein
MGNEFGDEPEIGPSDENDSDDVLDMTGASEAEVMKVFKAMKPEDGIVVKKEGGNVQFSDGENEYIIKLDGEETPEATPEETPEFSSEGGEEGDEFGGLAEQTEPEGKDEIVYEIELDDDDEEGKETEATEGKEDEPFTKAAPKNGVKKLQANEGKEDEPFTKTAPKNGVKKLQANEQETGVDKWSGTPLKGTAKPKTDDLGKGTPKTSDGRPGTGVKGVVKEPKEGMEVGNEECKECGGKEMEATEAARTKWNIHGDKGGADRTGIKAKKIFKAGAGEGKEINEEVETLRKQNAEYKKALILFKDKLNEVAVFNANLAYATRLFTEHSTTKTEKLNILKRFDSVSVITESRTLYNTIKTELETSKPLSETAAEKITSTPKTSSTEVLSEAKAYENPQFKRMKDLMNKIK